MTYTDKKQVQIWQSSWPHRETWQAACIFVNTKGTAKKLCLPLRVFGDWHKWCNDKVAIFSDSRNISRTWPHID